MVILLKMFLCDINQATNLKTFDKIHEKICENPKQYSQHLPQNVINICSPQNHSNFIIRVSYLSIKSEDLSNLTQYIKTDN